ncbi:MAG TPA: FAD-dependent oxidoreductase [Myxococcota bacterium]|nr:FAD-dependent oxidoreductase [Myxococcota bacterium]
MALAVCVVGAGPAGLVATKTLLSAGLDVDCFEASAEIGGHWVIDNPNGRSAAYRSLETNTTLRMSRLSDFDMPSDWPDFPGHAQVRAWFESYVDVFGFRERIRLRSEVLAAQPLEPAGWRVEVRTANGTVAKPPRYDAVVACSGNYWSPRTPAIPGEFEGEQVHAQRYRDPWSPTAVRGKRVLVVGIGNTGCELACEIAEAGAEAVFLSARSGTWMLPKRIDGRPAAESVPMMHPCDPVPGPLRALPQRWRERLFARIAARRMRQMFGARNQRMQALGLPPAPANPQDKRPTICDPLLDSLERGAVVARPGIERFEGKEVAFRGGSRERADLVLYATGYHLRYPYLPGDLVDTRHDDLTLFLGAMHPRRHDLFIVGVSRPTGAFWPIAEVQAQFAAALISGRYALPRQAEIDRRSGPILRRRAFNPALYGLAVREELARGVRRARRNRG